MAGFLEVKNRKNAKIIIYGFLLFWFLLCLVQGLGSGLNEDEAYYYFYSLRPAWGYFDHPPMVSLFALAGTGIFGKYIGLRFFVCLASVFFIWALWQLPDENKKWRQPWLFILLVSAMPMCSVYGFMLVPDAPLLCFAALFLVVYKQFLKRPGLWNSLLLGILAAAMMYSKYHAAVFILFVVASNLKLFKNRYFYISILTVLVLYTPHLLWLYHNDFAPFAYHFSGRYESPYIVKFGFLKRTIDFTGNQLLIFGLLISLFVLWAAAKTKIKKDSFTKALMYIFWGFIGFFLVWTFLKGKGRVEPHWTALATIPAIVLTFNFIIEKSAKIKGLFVGLAAVMAFLLLMIRVYLLIPEPPVITVYHKQREKMEAIENIAGEYPVVFVNSYQLPSLYTYYTSKPAYGLNDPHIYHLTQYDLLELNREIEGKKVLVIDKWMEPCDTAIKIYDLDTKGRFVENFKDDKLK